MSSMLKPLRVLIASPHPSVHGGVTNFIETLKPRLASCDVHSFWIGSNQDVVESRLKVFCRLVMGPVRLYRLMRRLNPDVVHLNPTLSLKSGVRDGLLMLAVIAARKRALIYWHGWELTAEHYIARHALVRAIFIGLQKKARLVTVLSPKFKDAMEHMGLPQERVVFTRTMFDGSLVERNPPMMQPARRNILFMSRFESGKGVYELLEGFAGIAADYPEIDLILAGDGPEMKGMKQAAAQRGLEKRVRFPGYVGGQEKARLLRECTVYALPSYLKGEGMPVAILEAMAAGKPLLVGTAGGIPYIVSEPENGIVLKTVTASSIAEGLTRLLHDPAYCETVGRRNTEYAWSRFEADIVSAEIESMYRQIAA